MVSTVTHLPVISCERVDCAIVRMGPCILPPTRSSSSDVTCPCHSRRLVTLEACSMAFMQSGTCIDSERCTCSQLSLESCPHSESQFPHRVPDRPDLLAFLARSKKADLKWWEDHVRRWSEGRRAIEILLFLVPIHYLQRLGTVLCRFGNGQPSVRGRRRIRSFELNFER
jgi:hypothetical protein